MPDARIDWDEFERRAEQIGAFIKTALAAYGGERFLRIAFTMAPIDELEPGIEVLGEAIHNPSLSRQFSPAATLNSDLAAVERTGPLFAAQR